MEVPDSLLAERAWLGLDVRDEMWDGVLHMAPQPATEHQRIGMRLVLLLAPVAERLGLEPFYETSAFRADDNYRVPDLVFVSPEVLSARGIEGPPAFAVEIRSPGDETYDKLGFYAAIGLRELLVVDRDTKAVELFVLADGALVAAEPDADGWLHSTSLGVSFRTAAAKVELDIAGTRTLIP